MVSLATIINEEKTMTKLILLTLPIGNLQDLTPRVREALEVGKYFLAEDTRNLVSLMKLLGISTEDKKIVSYHEHSDDSMEKRALHLLHQGNELYLCSDAGSPIISDPAFPLVRAVLNEKIEIDTYPGACSLIAALELSGLPPHPFQFHGFFPKENDKKTKKINEIKVVAGTHLFFESPHRIKETLEILVKAFPHTEFSVVREISKLYQSVYRFNSSSVNWEAEGLVVRGEFVLLFHIDKDQQKENGMDDEMVAIAEEVLAAKGRRKTLAKLLGKILSKPAKEIYASLDETN
jgi:16S rRNA (cytidine1402-2'-O)-methyltransferase